jgi:hypothetical protein
MTPSQVPEAVSAGAAARGAEAVAADRGQAGRARAAFVVGRAPRAGPLHAPTHASVLVAEGRGCAEATVDVGAAAEPADGGVHGAVEAGHARRRREVADKARAAGVIGVAAGVDDHAALALDFALAAVAGRIGTTGEGDNDEHQGSD